MFFHVEEECMIAFRKKTYSDEVLPASQFERGRIVWVPGPNGREAYVCIGQNGECLPMAEYREFKAKLAARNRAEHPFRRTRSLSRSPFSLW